MLLIKHHFHTAAATQRETIRLAKLTITGSEV
jgi:hypothetical protein